MPAQFLSIAKDFSRFPSGRFRSDGPHSGEAFREDYLVPRLKESGSLLVNLDGVAGLPSSFLEEAFGGLVRLHQFSPSDLEGLLRFEVLTPRMQTYPKMIWDYIARANRPVEIAR
ncbi:STAS-like domain-containing protein [Bradyrhizobium sp. 18]|nr:STAS-like domain-containing protein [Bradyrhizobium sp. 18]